MIASPHVGAQVLELPAEGHAAQLLRRGDTFAAIRELRRIETLRPRDGDNVLLLAYAYYLAGQKKLFVQKVGLAAELLPAKPEPQYALGRYYLDDLQRRDLAETAFRQALLRDPQHSSSLYHLGWCKELEQEMEEAARYYEQSKSWLGYLGLARIALDSAKPADALPLALTAARMKPDAPLVHALIGKIHQRNGDCKSAVPALRRAAELDPTDAGLLYQLSRCAGAIGDVALQRATIKQYNQIRATYSSQ
jgi:Flp pilus assembly protein TadD